MLELHNFIKSLGKLLMISFIKHVSVDSCEYCPREYLLHSSIVYVRKWIITYERLN